MPASQIRAEPAPVPTPAQRRTLLRYSRIENWPELARFPVPVAVCETLLAEMMHIGVEQLRALLADLNQERDRLAGALGAHPGMGPVRARLTVPPEPRIVAFGDSITADRIGWFDLLTVAISPGAGDSGWINLGVGGNTSADLLARYDLLVAARPTRVLLLVGTNDAREHAGGTRMASPGEFRRNLAALLGAIAGDLGVPVTLITPPAADQDRIDRAFAGQPVSWRADAIAEIARIVGTLDPTCVDIHAAMSDAGAAPLLEDDGIHPNGAGQQLIATSVLTRLAG